MLAWSISLHTVWFVLFCGALFYEWISYILFDKPCAFHLYSCHIMPFNSDLTGKMQSMSVTGHKPMFMT